MTKTSFLTVLSGFFFLNLIQNSFVTSQHIEDSDVSCRYLCKWSESEAGVERAVFLAGCRCSDAVEPLPDMTQYVDSPLLMRMLQNDDVTPKRKRQYASLDYGLGIPWSKNQKASNDDDTRKVFRYGRRK